jgi:alpha-D-ribose 1-methylphosphonate 5-triphosphate synthase subunit PhnG
MKRKQRTEILIRGRRRLAATLAHQIYSAYAVEMVENPEEGLVMVKMRENAQKYLFYIGEVYVTECKVRVHGSIGIGVVRGHQPELAVHLAVIDAAYRANLPQTQGWTAELLAEQKDIEEQQNRKHQLLLQTKVNFETMEEELN